MANATIDDVAKRAGVSIKTVSRVANKEPNVRPATREKVQKAMDELDYRPNLSARSLAGRKSYVIGLLFDNPSASYVLDVQTGVLSSCRARGYDLLIHPCSYEDPEVTKEIADVIRQTRVDGLILTPPVSDVPEIIELLNEQKIPFVRIAPAVEKENSPYVETNDQQAAFDMTQRLIELGHTRIGFITGHPDHKAVAYRYDGFREAMAESGLSIDPKLVVQGLNSFESGEEAARALLSRPRHPSAIFASNDDMAAGVIKVAHEMGIAIPGQLSVAGFDDSPVAHQIWPALTTVRQPIQEMARRATELLLQRVKGQKGLSNQVLASSIIVRDSVGPAPAGE
ncbi:LacI family DNA-binding transcriptional regulator [Marinimicrobium alkaliphilum]|uniref:LacI family DNA-binding transcriptional regulator n=1 Tax=Marinimicrobium alkaliphilum TaxID=2202654 RepID=UPI000DBA6091|nr:LacI family DNA-binding transcriptional regulator [Marinimicrobium alkaliphilum]